MPRPQSGFTLVELAIVLMIIGLLIGGILKGQELITNARVTSALRDVKSYEAATTTFRDSYAAWPGDMLSPGTRLPDCGATPVGAPCNTAGNNDGRFTTGLEFYNFWRHMAKANLISGLDTNIAFLLPKAPIGNGSARFMVLSNTALGNYFQLGNEGMGGVLTGPIAARIDRKMDDGIPTTGSVIADNDYSGDATVSCFTGTVYDETVSDELACYLMINTLP